MMDRVTRYPIFSIPHSAGMGLDADTSYTFELVNAGPSASGGGQDQPQAWATDRKAQLDMVRQGALHSQPALQSQHAKDEEMRVYHLDARDALPRQPWDLERERWAVIQGRAVIQGQAVRKSGMVATLRGPPDHGETRTQGRPQPLPLEENVIDREQIDFLAARQQFLSLEQENAGSPQKPAARAAPTSAPRAVSQAPRAPSGPSLANGYAVSVQLQAKEPESVPGLSTGSGVRSPAESPEAPKETPIEREIRLAQEREAALREQRGLQRAAGRQELVEVPARPLLTTVSLTAARRQDRGRPSLYVQRDMVQETQREKAHRREGLQLGRASPPGWVPEAPQPGLRRAVSSDCVLGAADPGAEVRKVNRIPADAYQPFLSPPAPRQEFPASRSPGRPGGSSAEGAQAAASAKAKAAAAQRPVSESSGKPPGTRPGRAKQSGAPGAGGGAVLRQDHFRLRPLRFGVPEGPQKAEAPRTWGWEEPGTQALRLQQSQSSELLEREVEGVLRREREVAKERRSALYPEVFSPPPDGDGDSDSDPDSRRSSAASGTMGSYAVSELLHLLPRPPALPPGVVGRGPGRGRPWQRKKELWYAGINPLDHVNSEVLEATRVTRHKNAKAERWEAHVYTSEDED